MGNGKTDLTVQVLGKQVGVSHIEKNIKKGIDKNEKNNTNINWNYGHANI